MNSERKKLYLYALINFLFGIITGIILFYANIKSGAEASPAEYTYDKAVDFSDLFRVGWLNIMWMICVFLAHAILPASFLHIVLWIRGAASGFSALYLLEFLGIKETVTSVFPQCVSFLPLLLWFSVACVQKRKKLIEEGKEPFIIKRKETALMFLLAFVSAMAETGIFSIFCRILF